MKELLLIIIAVLICLWFNTIEQKLDKLIELNTPEFVNVIPDVVITEKH